MSPVSLTDEVNTAKGPPVDCHDHDLIDKPRWCQMPLTALDAVLHVIKRQEPRPQATTLVPIREH